MGFIFYFSDEETDGPQFICSETALTPVLKSTAKSISNCAVGLLDTAPSTGSGLEVRQHSQEGYYLLYRSPPTSAHKDFGRPIPINPESMGNFSLKTTTTTMNSALVGQSEAPKKAKGRPGETDWQELEGHPASKLYQVTLKTWKQ